MVDPRPSAEAASAAALPVVPDLAAVRAAAKRIAPWIRRTPVLTSEALDELVGGEVLFKCECFQRTGAFCSPAPAMRCAR